VEESIGSIIGYSFVIIAVPVAIILGYRENSIGSGILYFFLLPWYFLGILLVLIFSLGIGCVFGLPAGIYYGIRNYIFSIRDNINNKAFKIIMIVITSVIIIMFLFYLIAIAYYLYGNFN
jgi:hypothetical protein